ncbi:hypothetical protein RR48_04614 [Papilio machaon]|uniref:Uncharacterized protein n=1 Tax=Papilio machaon TaxID=76193 RepID=A0A0N0PDP8_PAPMA|nr:hypothetical protein RR48_04614 [Papilio machaon]
MNRRFILQNTCLLKFVFGITNRANVNTAFSQFPNHVDFQKVNTIILNDEEYTVLKPTVHLVTDYFKEFVLKRRNTIETNRIFMDKNGFRHFWKGMEIPPQSLRKADSSIIKVGTSNSTPKGETEVTKSLSETSPTDKENEDITDTTVKNTPRRSKRRTTNHFYKPILRQSQTGPVPYDYMPLGRNSRRDVIPPHPSDVNLNYERLYPARRKWLN